MIYFTGDCHGNFRRFTSNQRARLPTEMQEGDYVIVLGDLGLLWCKSKALEYDLKHLSALPFKLLWVQGNHENYDMIAEYPLEMWNGGLVRHIVRDKIILLERGQVFNIDGKSIFAFGGAASHDIAGGVLDRSSPTYAEDRVKAIESGLPYRVKHMSWWEQELPNQAELQEGRDNLEKVGYKVDYVISHCLSTSMLDRLEERFGGTSGGRIFTPDILTDYFDEIESRLSYKYWLCGHYHVNLILDNKHVILYEDILKEANLRCIQ